MRLNKAVRALLIFLICAAAAGTLLARQATKPHLPASANALVRSVVENELRSNSDSSTLYAFKQRTERASGVTTKQIVETPDGVISRVLSKNDKPLSPEERKKDDSRINRLLDPKQMREKAKEQKTDEQRTRTMVQSLPDAFMYEYRGTEPGKNGTELVKLYFKPNQNFDPPTRETLVFEGMEGHIWIDPQAMRIAKIDGTMFRDVSIGWGIVGHLDKGGRFIVEQEEVAKGYWATTRLVLDFTGKALIFKNIRIKQTETLSDFRPVPRMTVAQALDFLRKSDDQLAGTNAKNGVGTK